MAAQMLAGTDRKETAMTTTGPAATTRTVYDLEGTLL